MRSLQARKALEKKVMTWSTERWEHHEKCNFRTSYQGKCNCNYALEKEPTIITKEEATTMLGAMQMLEVLIQPQDEVSIKAFTYIWNTLVQIAQPID